MQPHTDPTDTHPAAPPRPMINPGRPTGAAVAIPPGGATPAYQTTQAYLQTQRPVPVQSGPGSAPIGLSYQQMVQQGYIGVPSQWMSGGYYVGPKPVSNLAGPQVNLAAQNRYTGPNPGNVQIRPATQAEMSGE
jgi:hypothetical protein